MLVSERKRGRNGIEGEIYNKLIKDVIVNEGTIEKFELMWNYID